MPFEANIFHWDEGWRAMQECQKCIGHFLFTSSSNLLLRRMAGPVKLQCGA